MSTEQEAPELIGIGTQALVQNADRLGLKWQLRPATIATNNPLTATYDGDSEPIGMVSLIGIPVVDSRVQVIYVPPSGNFIIGGFGNYSPGRLTNRVQARATADLTLGVALADVAGTDINVTVLGRAVYVARGIFDFRETVSGNNLCVGALGLDSVDSGEFALLGVSNVQDRGTVPQEWVGTLTPGSHHFELRARNNAVAGTQVCGQTHTTLTVETWE